MMFSIVLMETWAMTAELTTRFLERFPPRAASRRQQRSHVAVQNVVNERDAPARVVR
jgi:hypothetical protein